VLYPKTERTSEYKMELPGLIARRETTLSHIHHRSFLKPRFLEANIFETKYHQNSFWKLILHQNLTLTIYLLFSIRKTPKNSSFTWEHSLNAKAFEFLLDKLLIDQFIKDAHNKFTPIKRHCSWSRSHVRWTLGSLSAAGVPTSKNISRNAARDHSVERVSDESSLTLTKRNARKLQQTPVLVHSDHRDQAHPPSICACPWWEASRIAWNGGWTTLSKNTIMGSKCRSVRGGRKSHVQVPWRLSCIRCRRGSWALGRSADASSSLWLHNQQGSPRVHQTSSEQQMTYQCLSRSPGSSAIYKLKN
jgi:hypothetical protein